MSTPTATARTFARWIALAAVIGLLSGLASGGFLLSLNAVTALHGQRPWLLYLLPLAGIGIAFLYTRYGKEAEGGNNLILDQIHDPQGRGVPLRMFPLVLLGTLGTHLFGGSAGREGTAVQMGGSIAATIARLFHLREADTRLVLMAGISAGFGSIFGTPLAGAVFGMEVLAVGGIRYEALIPCLLASVIGDWTVRALPVHHSHYALAAVPPMTAALLVKIALASVAFGLTSAAFAELTHAVGAFFKKHVKNPLFRPALGGAGVVLLTLLLGTRAYNGLSLPLLAAAFAPTGVPSWAFVAKLILTGLTLGAGFKGGEVTPLFVIGATLGATLGRLMGVPLDLMAALGFVAVFAGAANTPLACLLMGIELFGAPIAVPLALATFLGYTFSGHRGIYMSQRIAAPKAAHPDLAFHGLSLREVRAYTTAEEAVFTPLSGEIDRMYKLHANDEYGLVRIYMSMEDRHKSDTRRWSLFPKPLYRHVVQWAKEHGLPNAVVKQTFHGYVNHGPVKENHSAEHPHTHLNIYVELAGQRHALESFVHKHADVLKRHFITYKSVEHWQLTHDLGLTLPDAVAS